MSDQRLVIPTTVEGLQGRPISQAVPQNGQALVYSGTANQWAPGSPIITGVTDGSNAAAGQVGEFVSAVQLNGVSCADSQPTAVTSIALTPGDWEVCGEVWFSGAVGGGAISTSAIINTAVFYPSVPAVNAAFTTVGTLVGAGTDRIPTSTARMSSSSAVTAYLVGMGVGGTCTAYGKIQARRMR